MTRSVARLGLWSGIACAVLSVAFSVLMVLDISGVLSGTFQLIPMLLLAPCFVVLVACIDDNAAPDAKLWTKLGLSFSVAYAVVVSFNYLMQLTVVPQNPARYAWLAMEFRPDSMFGALELLGYCWQCLAMFALVPLFAWKGSGRVIKSIFLANGILATIATVADIITANPLHPVIMASLGVWCLTFPVATLLIGITLFGEPRIAQTWAK